MSRLFFMRIDNYTILSLCYILCIVLAEEIKRGTNSRIQAGAAEASVTKAEGDG